MTYRVNASSVFDGISSNVSHATLLDSVVGSGRVGPILTLGVIFVTGLVLFINQLRGQPFIDKHGNKIQTDLGACQSSVSLSRHRCSVQATLARHH